MAEVKVDAPDDRPMTAEELGQTSADRPFDGDWIKQRRMRNWAILGVVAAITVMFYFITMIRIEQGAEARKANEAARAAAEQANAVVTEAITPDVTSDADAMSKADAAAPVEATDEAGE